MAIDLLKKIWPEWQIGERIGGGSYGVVYEATRTDYNVESHAAISFSKGQSPFLRLLFKGIYLRLKNHLKLFSILHKIIVILSLPPFMRALSNRLLSASLNGLFANSSAIS